MHDLIQKCFSMSMFIFFCFLILWPGEKPFKKIYSLDETTDVSGHQSFQFFPKFLKLLVLNTSNF